MVFNAIYFKHKDCCHLKVSNAYSNVDHILINGKVTKINGYISADGDYTTLDFVVEGSEVKVQVPNKKQMLSHYVNRESNEKMSKMDYDDSLKSFLNSNGDYKDLESEYLYKKMKQLYVPVYNTYYEYEDAPVQIEEGEYKHDKYTVCSGLITKFDDNKEHFIYRFNKWKYANDAVKEIMEELGIEKVNHPSEAKTSEFYILHNSRNDYKWLELCDREYFITNKDFFNGSDSNGYIYWSYSKVIECQKAIRDGLLKRITDYLDSIRTVRVKKSLLSEIRYGLCDLASMINNKKIKYNEVSPKIMQLSYKLDIK